MLRSMPTLLLILLAVPPALAAGPCGHRYGDWCAAPAGDPCGRHITVKACAANPACRGLPYLGESAVACRLDERGFGMNCPTVGCVSPAR